MNINRFFIWITAFILIAGCTSPVKKDDSKRVDQVALDSVIAHLTQRAGASNHHFSFGLTKSSSDKFLLFAGYNEYCDYESENPAYLKVFKKNEQIFEDSFAGYEKIRVQDFDGYLFNDSIQLFTLKFGLAACDYLNSCRLYYAVGQQVGLIGEFDSQSTDYASKYIEYHFPTDSGGVKNQILVIDKIEYRTGEEPNKADSTYYNYTDGQFIKLEQPANDRDK